MDFRFGKILIIVCFGSWIIPGIALAQKPDPKDIIEKADARVRGKTSYAEMTMTIVRPKWTRAISMKSWSKGQDKALIYITEPARDKGTVFLKRNKEMWNYRPTIDRTIKMPPSMMMQSWMGSDFTNDDLVRESSIVLDYKHTLAGEEKISGYDCWKISLTPLPSAPVVWGRIDTWIDKKDYMQLMTKFYDENGTLINVMEASDIRDMSGKKLPAKLTMVPEDKPGHKTIVTYSKLIFDQALEDQFFTEQQMRRVQ